MNNFEKMAKNARKVVENAKNWRMGWISFWTGPKIKQTGLNRFRTGPNRSKSEPNRPCKEKEKKPVQTRRAPHVITKINPLPLLLRSSSSQSTDPKSIHWTQTPSSSILISHLSLPHLFLSLRTPSPLFTRPSPRHLLCCPSSPPSRYPQIERWRIKRLGIYQARRRHCWTS